MVYCFRIVFCNMYFCFSKAQAFYNSSLVIVGWKSLISSEINLQFCLFLMLFNQLMTSLVFFDWLTLVAFRRFRFILSSIPLRILIRSFDAGFNRRVFGMFKKFSLWSFRVLKQLFLPLINILSNAVLRLLY